MHSDATGLRRRALLRAGVGAFALSTATAGAAGAGDPTDGATAAGSSGSIEGAAAAGSNGSTEGAAYAPRGAVDVDDAAEVVVDERGDTAFVAIGSGFATVDVSDPANPTVLAERRNLTDPEGVDVVEVLDVAYDDDRLLVPSAAQATGPKGFYVFDVSDPANPERVGDWFRTGTANHNAVLHDGVAYVTSFLELEIVDVSGDEFLQLATWEPGNWREAWARPPNTTLHDLYVQGDRAYCAYWDGGVFLLDVSDPRRPRFVSRVGEYTREELAELSQGAYLEPPGNAHYVAVNEDASLLAEGGESWDLDADDDSGGPSGITLYDLADESNPERVATIDPPVSANDAYRGGTWTTSHNFDLRGGRLYASWYQGGVSVHDVSDPASPERLAWWAAPDERAFWTAQLARPRAFFVASSHAVNGATPGVVTFPDAAGEMADPPGAVAWARADLEARTTTNAENETTTGRTAPTTTEPTATTTTATVEEGGSPGFGPVAALGGLALGAARSLRGRRSADADDG